MAEVPQEIFHGVATEYMPPIMDAIKARAAAIAEESGRSTANFVDVFRAFEQTYASARVPPFTPKGTFLRDHIFLIVVVLMTIGFGVMGLAPYLWGDPSKVGYKPDVFLDIAKLFAGVVVGGAAGANAVSAARRASISPPST